MPKQKEKAMKTQISQISSSDNDQKTVKHITVIQRHDASNKGRSFQVKHTSIKLKHTSM